MTLKTVVLIAMPRPSVTTAMIAKPGAFRSDRIAYLMSCQKLCIVVTSRDGLARFDHCKSPPAMGNRGCELSLAESSLLSPLRQARWVTLARLWDPLSGFEHQVTTSSANGDSFPPDG